MRLRQGARVVASEGCVCVCVVCVCVCARWRDGGTLTDWRVPSSVRSASVCPKNVINSSTLSVSQE